MKKIIVIVIILLVTFLGTRHNIWGCGWTEPGTFSMYIRGMYFRGLGPPKVNVTRTTLFKTISENTRAHIGSLECMLEYGDGDDEAINKELDILYKELYDEAVKAGYYYYYD